jgi:DNA-binding IclR family transcriptional regulator
MTGEPSIEQLFPRARGEFLEMPGLRLTPQQAARLWAVDPAMSERLLDALAQAGFLNRNSAGAYSLTSMA